MEIGFMNVIETIIEKLECGDFESYTYKDNLFHIIDKNECLDFQVKFGKNNYYFKDNIQKMMYMFVKKYLDKETTLQKIFFDNGQEQFYYSFLEKEGFIRMARLIRKNEEEHIICDDTELMGKSDGELLKYAYENLNTFDEQGNESGKDVEKFDVDKYNVYDDCKEDNTDRSKLKVEYYVFSSDNFKKNEAEELDDDEDELEDDEDELSEEDERELEEEFFDDDEADYIDEDEDEEEDCENISEDEIVENFEEITIQEFMDLISEQAETSLEENYDEKDIDLEVVSKLYKPFTVVVNGEKQEDVKKILIAQECELIVESKFFSSVVLTMAANEIKSVLDAINKNMEPVENNERIQKREENKEPEK